ncbi:hypothetical protein [Pueribacillus sp. YX66]|uniref:hypothetical protein n=1 Tax=Pueribacillus sp. YX66 TaxID=3229242 RepID=UPI00358D069F
MKRTIKMNLAILFLFMLMSGCSQKTNYETDGPFIIVKTAPAGPDDVRNLFTEHYAIEENGMLTLYTEATNRIKLGNDAPVLKIKLSDKEVEKVKELIRKNKFWNFKEDLSNLDVSDGYSLYITVNLTDESKTVGGWNPDKPEFTEIANYVMNLASGEKRRAWLKEIQNHILKMNPD